MVSKPRGSGLTHFFRLPYRKKEKEGNGNMLIKKKGEICWNTCIFFRYLKFFSTVLFYIFLQLLHLGTGSKYYSTVNLHFNKTILKFMCRLTKVRVPVDVNSAKIIKFVVVEPRVEVYNSILRN